MIFALSDSIIVCFRGMGEAEVGQVADFYLDFALMPASIEMTTTWVELSMKSV